MQIAPVLTRIAFGTLLLLIGFAAGFYAASTVRRAQLWHAAVFQSGVIRDHAMLQYREAAYPDARKALEDLIAHLDRSRPASDDWKPGEDPWLDERGIRLEKTLAWSHLAVLHERNRQAAAAEAAWARAEALARQGSWRDPSRANLRRIVERLNRSVPPPGNR